MKLRSSHHFIFNPLRNAKGGMTLVELLVVIAIFIIVATTILFSYGNFRSSISLQNLADDISLAIRKAQSKAIGVGSSQNSFSNGYGIHFSTNTAPGNAIAGSNKSFILFNDKPDTSNHTNKLYDYSAGSSVCNSTDNECIDLLNITSSDEVVAICATGSSSCSVSTEETTTPTFHSADIVFLRPNPDAYICIDETSSYECTAPQSSIDIVIKNIQSGHTKTITVTKVGQISVK